MSQQRYSVSFAKGPGNTPNSKVVFIAGRTPNAVKGMAESRIANLPNRLSVAPSLAQSLAGTGALVFEGELLDI